jgi:hypothetical protein
LWGGDAANRWSASKLKELGLFNGETAVSVGSSYSGQFGPGKKYKAPAQLAAIEDIDLQEYEQGPCYEGYVQIGMKDKDGRMVPNCVPDPNVKASKNYTHPAMMGIKK